jgi:acyl carrier protein
MTSASTRRTITDAEIEEILIRNVGAPPELFSGRDDVALAELGLDSLALLELQAVVKERFSVEIPEHGLEMSVSQIVTYANEHLGG